MTFLFSRKLRPTASLAALVAFALPVMSARAELRQWADAHGTAQLTAEFLRFEETKVVLRTENGNLLKVPEAGLRATDRNYLQQIRTHQTRNLFREEAALNEGYALRRELAKKVRGRYELQVNYRDLKAKEWVWFAGQPPETGGQVIQSNLFPNSTTIQDESGSGRRLWRARVPANSSQPGAGSIKFVVGGNLYSRTLERSGAGSSPIASLSPEERKQFTKTDEVFSLEAPPFQEWLRTSDLIRKRSREGQIDFARRVFLLIAKDFEYLYTRDLDRSFAFMCEAKKSDCGGLSTLFVSAMRANGIPARTLAGRWAKSAVAGEKLGGVPYSQYHVKAEFWAEGVGWVPVDMACAVDKPNPESQLRYFGEDKGDFIAMHFDYQLLVDTIHFGRQPIRCLQGARFWVTGSGELTGRDRKETWVVEEL